MCVIVCLQVRILIIQTPFMRRLNVAQLHSVPLLATNLRSSKHPNAVYTVLVPEIISGTAADTYCQ